MPFIDSRISCRMSDEKKDLIKNRFGKAISLLSKPESYLMVGIQDDYCLYFAGERLEKGAYVSVSLFGKASTSAYNQMTKAICDILQEELDIPGDHVYVTFHSVNDWGWDGELF